MRAHLEPSRARHGLRLALLGIMAAGIAGCSADTTRFSENPFSNPQPRTAAYAPPAPAETAAVGRIDAQPLPPPQSASLPPVSSTGQVVQASYSPAGGDVTGSLAGRGNWNGGTPVTVEPGDTVDSMARRYGVPASAILQANRLSSPAQVQPGQRIVIPRYDAAVPVRTAARPHGPRPQATPVGATHIVQSGETLSSLGRRYGKSREEIARANNLPLDAKTRIGQAILIPGVRQTQTAATPVQKSTPAPATEVRRAEAKPAAPVQKVASAEPAASARMASAEPASDPAPEPTAANGSPSFRWPARGRVIAGFGPKPNGQQNDGINLALPEGTTIKAADDGVVAYAGSELKGYGNLVLVRHSNGYVTAYAHASELAVKRGDSVKRGQMIGKAGQTGNVNSPQLHFEIRKGKDPVDPMQYLAGG